MDSVGFGGINSRVGHLSREGKEGLGEINWPGMRKVRLIMLRCRLDAAEGAAGGACKVKIAVGA